MQMFKVWHLHSRLQSRDNGDGIDTIRKIVDFVPRLLSALGAFGFIRNARCLKRSNLAVNKAGQALQGLAVSNKLISHNAKI
jgi:hypothetical protein